MKKIISLVLVITLIFSLSSPVFAVDQPITSTGNSDSVQYRFAEGLCTIAASYKIGYMGAAWSSQRNCWEFNFRVVGTGSARTPSGGRKYAIRCALIDINSTYNSSNMSYWTSNAAKYIGSAPETSGSTADYANLMSAIAGMAITVLNNLGVSYAWSAITLAAAIRNVVDSTSNNNTGLTRDWEWSSDVSDVGQYFWFLVDVNAGKQVKFSTDYCILGPGYEIVDAGTSIYTCTAPAAPSAASASELAANNVEKIARSDFLEKAEELELSDKIIKEFTESDEAYFYYAHSPQVTVSHEAPVDSNTTDIRTTTELLTDIEKHIFRSERIIRGFSINDANYDENKGIIEKHVKRIDKLNELRAEINSASHSRTGYAFDELLQRYTEAIQD